MRKCKNCGSEFVCWNWIYSRFWKTWLLNFRVWWNDPIHFLLRRWTGECWNCGRYNETMLKVRDGIKYEDLESKFVRLPIHEFRYLTEDVYWMLSQGKGYTEAEKYKFDIRKKHAINDLEELLEKQWEIDHKKEL